MSLTTTQRVLAVALALVAFVPYALLSFFVEFLDFIYFWVVALGLLTALKAQLALPARVAVVTVASAALAVPISTFVYTGNGEVVFFNGFKSSQVINPSGFLFYLGVWSAMAVLCFSSWPNKAFKRTRLRRAA